MLGDGVRRSLATVSKAERDLFIDAVKRLNQLYYPGSRPDFPAGRVSYWFKQDEIHQGTHVHHVPAFLPWHREMCNRFEASLRSVHPQLSLHYWDWNLDPSHMLDPGGNVINLFDSDFMGNADAAVNGGAVGEPLLSAGFYVPTAVGDAFRDDSSPHPINKPDPSNPSTWSYQLHANPADPPKTLTRGKPPGAPPVGKTLRDPFNGDWTPVTTPTPTSVYWPTDSEFRDAASWEAFNDRMQGIELGTSINGAHALAHSFIGGLTGTLTDPHTAFRDPFVYLFHANIDRLWALWQHQKPAVRLDPAQVYGSQENTQGSGDVEFGDPNWGILSPLEPWAGIAAQTAATGFISNIIPVRPWFAPENEQNLPENQKDSRAMSVVLPAKYDTDPPSAKVRKGFKPAAIETRLEAVRRILDSVTGTRAPFHQGKRRFWNLPRDQFVSASVYGELVIVIGKPDDSALIKALKGVAPFDGSRFPRMPIGGPYVNDADIAFIAQWIKDGCPDSDPAARMST
jgi:hypothetical protein